MTGHKLKIDTSLMFDPVKVGSMAGELERAGFDGAYTLRSNQRRDVHADDPSTEFERPQSGLDIDGLYHSK